MVRTVLGEIFIHLLHLSLIHLAISDLIEVMDYLVDFNTMRSTIWGWF